MPWMAKTEERRPHPNVRRRACRDRFRGHICDGAQTEDIVCAVRSTYGGGASAAEGDVWGVCWGKGYSGGQKKDWIARLKEDISVVVIKFEGWRKAAQKVGRRFRRVEERPELFLRNLHEMERSKASERHVTAVTGTSTVGVSKLPRAEGNVPRGSISTALAMCRWLSQSGWMSFG